MKVGLNRSRGVDVREAYRSVRYKALGAEVAACEEEIGTILTMQWLVDSLDDMVSELQGE